MKFTSKKNASERNAVVATATLSILVVGLLVSFFTVIDDPFPLISSPLCASPSALFFVRSEKGGGV